MKTALLLFCCASVGITLVVRASAVGDVTFGEPTVVEVLPTK
jgi:hypothetical protein